jgi:hypothetical protein
MLIEYILFNAANDDKTCRRKPLKKWTDGFPACHIVSLSRPTLHRASVWLLGAVGGRSATACRAGAVTGIKKPSFFFDDGEHARLGTAQAIPHDRIMRRTGVMYPWTKVYTHTRCSILTKQPPTPTSHPQTQPVLFLFLCGHMYQRRVYFLGGKATLCSGVTHFNEDIYVAVYDTVAEAWDTSFEMDGDIPSNRHGERRCVSTSLNNPLKPLCAPPPPLPPSPSTQPPALSHQDTEQ